MDEFGNDDNFFFESLTQAERSQEVSQDHAQDQQLASILAYRLDE